MLICLYDSKVIIHKEFVPPGQTVTGKFYLGVMKRLLSRIRRIRPDYREISSWTLLHDNAPSHRSRLVTEFLAKNHVIPLHLSPYSPDLATCDFYLFFKLHLAMKGNWHASIDEIFPNFTITLASSLVTATMSNCIENPLNDFRRVEAKFLIYNSQL